MDMDEFFTKAAFSFFIAFGVVLGGALINSYDRFYDTAIGVARKNVYYYPEYEPVFTKGELREDAVATGAALMMWKKMPV